VTHGSMKRCSTVLLLLLGAYIALLSLPYVLLASGPSELEITDAQITGGGSMVSDGGVHTEQSGL
jgi:hypothetical protein